MRVDEVKPDRIQIKSKRITVNYDVLLYQKDSGLDKNIPQAWCTQSHWIKNGSFYSFTEMIGEKNPALGYFSIQTLSTPFLLFQID